MRKLRSDVCRSGESQCRLLTWQAISNADTRGEHAGGLSVFEVFGLSGEDSRVAGGF